MQSHSDGEVWGLAALDSYQIVTSADDNSVRIWNITDRKQYYKAIVSNQDRKVKRGGASTLSTLPDSKCSRAVAFLPDTLSTAVGHNDGTVTIRQGFDQV